MTAIRLISKFGGGQVAIWKPADGKKINVVSANDHQALCACGKQLYYFELGSGQITLARYGNELYYGITCDPVLTITVKYNV